MQITPTTLNLIRSIMKLDQAVQDEKWKSLDSLKEEFVIAPTEFNLHKSRFSSFQFSGSITIRKIDSDQYVIDIGVEEKLPDTVAVSATSKEVLKSDEVKEYVSGGNKAVRQKNVDLIMGSVERLISFILRQY